MYFGELGGGRFRCAFPHFRFYIAVADAKNMIFQDFTEFPEMYFHWKTKFTYTLRWQQHGDDDDDDDDDDDALHHVVGRCTVPARAAARSRKAARCCNLLIVRDGMN